MAQQEEQRANYAVWEAQTDAQIAEALKRLPPAQPERSAGARSVLWTDYLAKSQQHTRMMEQERAEYMATHPYTLSNAQAADISRLLDLNIRRNGLNQNVAMDRILRKKLLADLTAAKDTTSQRSYRAQIERDDARRRHAEQEMRLLEPRIARQKAVVALIPEDQRTLMDKLRHYDIERLGAAGWKRSPSSGAGCWVPPKPPRHPARRRARRMRRATIEAAPAPAESQTSSFPAVADGGPPAPRLAQLMAQLPVTTACHTTDDDVAGV